MGRGALILLAKNRQAPTIAGNERRGMNSIAKIRSKN